MAHAANGFPVDQNGVSLAVLESRDWKLRTDAVGVTLRAGAKFRERSEGRNLRQVQADY